VNAPIETMIAAARDRQRGKASLRFVEGGTRLPSGVVARPSPVGEHFGSICPLRMSRRLTGGYAPMVPLGAS
jgi:hypothetical protein